MVSATPEITHDQSPRPSCNSGNGNLNLGCLVTCHRQQADRPQVNGSVRSSRACQDLGLSHSRIGRGYSDGFKRINPLAPNLDFLAAILGGDERMGHKVIYLEGEMQLYYLDQPSGIFKPTSEEKLGISSVPY